MDKTYPTLLLAILDAVNLSNLTVISNKKKLNFPTLFPGAGDGLFAKVDLPANTACAFYNGIRVKPGQYGLFGKVSLSKKNYHNFFLTEKLNLLHKVKP